MDAEYRDVTTSVCELFLVSCAYCRQKVGPRLSLDQAARQKFPAIRSVLCKQVLRPIEDRENKHKSFPDCTKWLVLKLAMASPVAPGDDVSFKLFPESQANMPFPENAIANSLLFTALREPPQG